MNSDAGRRIAILRGLPFFQHLTFHEMLSLLLIVYEHTFRPGDTIVAEGSAGQHLFVIVSGTVSVTSKDVELTKLGPGREFGSLSFVDGVRRSATVKAETDVIALTIDRDDFLTQLAPRDPHLATRLTWSLLQHVAGRLREITDDYVGATSGRLKAAK
jgi:CRP-like cAMP-binding protein